MAGLLIGVVASVKPPYALWPLLLLVGGHYRVALPALLTGGIIGILPAFVFGPMIYEDWLSVPISDTLTFQWPNNMSLIALTQSEALGMGLFAAIGLISTVWIRLMRPDAMRISAIAVLLTLLAGPIAWRGYLIFSMPLVLSRTRGVTFWASLALMVMGLHAFVTYMLVAIVAFDEWRLMADKPVKEDATDLVSALEEAA